MSDTAEIWKKRVASWRRRDRREVQRRSTVVAPYTSMVGLENRA
jgi:hypothetical protein